MVDAQSRAGGERATLTPIVVIEVLSASTDYDHHVEKFARYARRETLRDYAVFDQRRPLAFLWSRDEEGWPASPALIEGEAAEVDFPAVPARLRFADIYRTVPG